MAFDAIDHAIVTQVIRGLGLVSIGRLWGAYYGE
jgi:hypothetical protein